MSHDPTSSLPARATGAPPARTRSSALPGRVVVGGYSLSRSGDAAGAGTGLRVLGLERDPDRDEAAGPGYRTTGHVPLPSPTWVVPHPTRPCLVAVSETAPSLVTCLRLEDDGGLTVLEQRTTGGDSACHLALTADGRQVLVAHYGSGTVESFALDDEGRLTGPTGRYVSTAPLGPDAERQEGPHAHQVVLDPGRPGEVLVCDLGTDRVHRLRLDPDGGLTETAPALVLPPGFGPRHLVVADETLVVAGELAVEVWVARREGDGWRPTQTVATTRRTPAERARSGGPVAPSALRLAGDRVVVATRGVDTVSTFALDRATGGLTFVAETSCGGEHPRDLVVSGDLAWVANQWSDEVVVLDLGGATAGRDGAAVVLRVPVPRPACVVLLDPPAGDPDVDQHVGGGRR